MTLRNDSAEPVMVQVQTFAWPRTLATADLEPTRELIAVPPVFALAGNAKQIIRVALRGARAGAARAGLSAADHRGAAWWCRRHRGAVRPAAEPAGVRDAGRCGAAAGLVLGWTMAGGPRLVNEGDAHLQVSGYDPRVGPTGARADHRCRRLRAARPGAGLAAVRRARAQSTLQLEAETNLGPIEASLVLPQG